jgi:hypothetical protein
MRLAFVVTWVTGEPLREASKKEMGCWRRRVRKAVRRALVVRREDMEMETWITGLEREREVGFYSLDRATYCPEVNQRKLANEQIHKIEPRRVAQIRPTDVAAARMERNAHTQTHPNHPETAPASSAPSQDH